MYLETNPYPSQVVIRSDSGVQSNMNQVLPSPPHFDGVKCEDMLNNPIYDRSDRLDKVGKVTAALADKLGKYQKSEFHTSFIRKLQK